MKRKRRSKSIKERMREWTTNEVAETGDLIKLDS